MEMVLGNCIEVRKFSLYCLTTNHMDLNVSCLDDKMGIRSQSRCSTSFNGFMKGGQAPDSIKGLSAVIS